MRIAKLKIGEKIHLILHNLKHIIFSFTIALVLTLPIRAFCVEDNHKSEKVPTAENHSSLSGLSFSEETANTIVFAGVTDVNNLGLKIEIGRIRWQYLQLSALSFTYNRAKTKPVSQEYSKYKYIEWGHTGILGVGFKYNFLKYLEYGFLCYALSAGEARYTNSYFNTSETRPYSLTIGSGTIYFRINFKGVALETGFDTPLFAESAVNNKPVFYFGIGF